MASKALEKARTKGRKNRSSIDSIKMGPEPVFNKGAYQVIPQSDVEHIGK